MYVLPNKTLLDQPVQQVHVVPADFLAIPDSQEYQDNQVSLDQPALRAPAVVQQDRVV
jgi:hypothetical protein